MTNTGRQTTIRQSIIDRLVQSRADEPKTWAESVSALRASVLRDLESLLNTRETGDPAHAPHDELERSIYNYGLLDFASMFADEAASAARLARVIERKIELFEPRLVDVRVDTESQTSVGRFLIQARLRLDPDPDRIEFDTVVEVSGGHFRASE